MTASFTSAGGSVLLANTPMPDWLVEAQLTKFEEIAAKADAEAREARKAFNALYDARCAAMDYRQDRARPAMMVAS